MNEIEFNLASQVRNRLFSLRIRSWLNNTGHWLYRYRPRYKNWHFWVIQVFVLGIAIFHDIIEMGEYFPHFEVLYFIPVTLFFVPIIYAALIFGSTGAIATVVWIIIITIPNWVFWHEGLERIGVIFQMSLLIAVAWIAGRRVDNEIKAKNQVEHSSKVLKTYATHIVEAQEDERKKIAHELHDQTIQALSLIAQLLSSMKERNPSLSSELNEDITEAHEIAMKTTRELREFTRSIHPPILDDLGLVPSIRRLLIEFSERTGIKSKFNLMGEERRFPKEIEIGIFRIAQEAIRNAERHSKATEMVITITSINFEVNLNIVDNGIGFEVPTMLGNLYDASKLGLLGMHERAELIGGKMEIQSTPDKGTTLRLSVTVPS